MTKEQLAFNKRWLAALRSGEYEQTTGVHKDENGCFCVLGVGYSLCPGAKFVPMGRDWMASGGQIVPNLLKEHSGLPDVVLSHAFSMNDGPKAPFTEIADYLEGKLP
jgi:hypothetical protein